MVGTVNFLATLIINDNGLAAALAKFLTMGITSDIIGLLVMQVLSIVIIYWTLKFIRLISGIGDGSRATKHFCVIQNVILGVWALVKVVLTINYFKGNMIDEAILVISITTIDFIDNASLTSVLYNNVIPYLHQKSNELLGMYLKVNISLYY